MKSPDFSKYIKNSFELVKKNKWLWIFGALVGSGGGSSFNSGFDFAKNSFPKEQVPSNYFKNSPDITAKVLGDNTNALVDWLKQIPPSKWILFAFLVLILVVIGVTIMLLILNWARGSLIAGIDNAEKGKKTNLENTSPTGFKFLKKLILLSLLISGTIFGLTVGIPFLWLAIYLIISPVMIIKILWIIIGVIGLISIVIFSFLISTLINSYAERLIVLKNYSVVEAFKKAIIISKSTLLASMLTGLVNFVIKIIVGISSVVLLGILIGIPIFLAVEIYKSNPVYSAVLATITAMSLLIFITITSVLGSALNVFCYSNWNQLFNDYFEDHEDHS